jgi:TatD DNase family protein
MSSISCAGVTGVVTFSSNKNTSAVIRHLASLCPSPPPPSTSSTPTPFRILLETDSPFMIPANLDRAQLGLKANHKLPFSHSAMIPSTAAFVAKTAGGSWTTADVLRVCKDNARFVYGVGS